MFGRWIGLPKRLMQGINAIFGEICYLVNQTERIITIMTNTQSQINDLTAQLAGVSEQLSKAIEEIKAQVSTLEADISTLEAQIVVGDDIDLSDLKSTIVALKGSTQTLDDLNPDAPAPTPEPALETPATEPETPAGPTV